ncbi:MAG: S41 family peptidase [Tunicatimonas sp.]
MQIRRLSTLFYFCFCLNLTAWCQAQLTATQAYEYLQDQRQRAREAVGEGNSHPSPDSLKKAISILQAALEYYYRPDVQSLAQDDEPLFYRETDMLFDLAYNQVRANQNDAAVASLSKPLNSRYGSAYAELVNEDSTFASLWRHPILLPVLNEARASQRLFNSSALQTPYSPNISEAEKVAGLSKLWSEAKYNFVYFDQVPDLDWDQLYLEYLPKVTDTQSTLEYYKLLQAFYAQLQDGHTGLWTTSDTLGDLVYGRPALLTRLVENKVLVDEVFSDSLRQLGIRPGVEIIHIDEMPVHTYANQWVRPYQGGSTPQNVDVATYTYQLLRGAKNQPVEITFGLKDSVFQHTLSRTGYTDYHASPDFAYRLLPGNVAYVALNSFENDDAWNDFVAVYDDSIASTDALILDMRRNGGGDSGYGWNILGYLTDTAFQTSANSSRLYSPLRRARGEGVVYEALGKGTWSPQGEKVYSKPVVVLTSAQTFSAAEDLVVAFDAMERGTLIGETTGGSTGQPLAFAVPGGIMARVCAKRDTYPDGTEWIGKGIEPDMKVHPTVADLQAGRDTVLKVALEHLHELENTK